MWLCHAQSSAAAVWRQLSSARRWSQGALGRAGCYEGEASSCVGIAWPTDLLTRPIDRWTLWTLETGR